MNRRWNVGLQSSSGIQLVNHGSGVLIEGLHICRQNLRIVGVAEQLSDGKS
jgi:hypothetical protein